MKMQEVSFTGIGDFFDYLTPQEKEIVEVLRNLIIELCPGVKEKVSYNVPFYSRNKTLFFLWPASVKWGKKQSYDGVRMGFTQAFRMPNPNDFLVKDGRKQVYWHDFHVLEDIDLEMVKFFILEAIVVDDDLASHASIRKILD